MRRSALLAAMLLLAPALARGGEPKAAPTWPDGVRATRMKLVRALGLGAPDTGYAVFECPNCGRDLVAPATFPGAEGPDSVLDVRLAVERFFLAGHETGRIRPAPECPHCRGPVPGKKLPRAILFGHVSGEAGGDLQLLGEIEAHAFKKLRLALVPFDPKLPVKTVDYPKDSAAFRAAFGCDLALREVWRALVREAEETQRIGVHPVGRGYVLLATPTGGNDVARARVEKEYPAAHKRAREEFGCTETLGLDLLSDSFPPGSSLRPDAWLGKGLAALVVEGKVIAEVAFSDEVLRERWRAELVRAGYAVAFEGERRNEAVVSRGGIESHARLEPVVMATLAGGDTFGEGLRQHGWVAAARVEKLARLVRTVRAKLRVEKVQALGGRVLVVHDPEAGELRAPLAPVAEAAEAGGAALEKALAGVFAFDPATGRLRGASRSLTRCACGRSVYLARRLRSAAWLKSYGAGLLAERFGEGEGDAKVHAVYTLGCGQHELYVGEKNAWGLAREAARKRFGADLAGQVYVLAGAKQLAEGTVVVYGRDVAGVLTHPRLASGLLAKMRTPEAWKRMHLWAPVTDAVVVSREPVPGTDKPRLARKISLDVSAMGLDALEIDAEVSIERAEEPAGIFIQARAVRE